MKTSILITCLIIYGHNISMKAQSSNLHVTERPPKSKITLLSRPDTIIGALYELKDSSILLSNTFKPKDYTKGNFELAELYIDDIYLIKTRRRTRPARGAGIGLAVGAATGALVTRIAIGPPPYEAGWFWPENYSYFATVPAGAVVGAITGAIIGSIQIKIPINGSMNNYNNQKKKLGRYTIQYPGAPTY